MQMDQILQKLKTTLMQIVRFHVMFGATDVKRRMHRLGVTMCLPFQLLHGITSPLFSYSPTNPTTHTSPTNILHSPSYCFLITDSTQHLAICMQFHF